MSKWVYTVVSGLYSDPGQSGHIGYGIMINAHEQPIVVSDIYTDENDAVHLADLFNRLQLSPIHIWDAVEDALAV